VALHPLSISPKLPSDPCRPLCTSRHPRARHRLTSVRETCATPTLFEYFFGSGFGFEPQPRSGTGSGVIYTNDGYIITNNHVVDFADEFEVTLHDNREFHGRLVGRDANTDMAVIKIDASDLPGY
jgi:S1-C subfamily serine protease